MTGAIVITSSTPLWYATRATGLAALVLLTASMAMGLLSSVRFQRPAWPRFVTLGLHRNLALLARPGLAGPPSSEHRGRRPDRGDAHCWRGVAPGRTPVARLERPVGHADSPTRGSGRARSPVTARFRGAARGTARSGASQPVMTTIARPATRAARPLSATDLGGCERWAHSAACG